MALFSPESGWFRQDDLLRPSLLRSVVVVALSILVHAGFLIALSFSYQPTKKDTWGHLLGATRAGIEVYLVQSTSTGNRDEGTLSNKAVSLNDVSAAKTVQTDSPPKKPETNTPSPNVSGIQYTGVHGVLQPLPHLATSSARPSGFVGMPVPSGNPQGLVSTEMEWSMRRQAAIRMINTQADFLRQAFYFPETVSCLVTHESAVCHPSRHGLAEMLSALYLETHTIDPSLPPVAWTSQGYGVWSYEFKN